MPSGHPMWLARIAEVGWYLSLALLAVSIAVLIYTPKDRT